MRIWRKIFNNKGEGQNKNTSDLFRLSIDVFFKHFENHENIYNQISKLTNDPVEVDLIFLFIPHFLCRNFIPEVKWQDYYLELDQNKNKNKKSLNSSKTLIELKKFIKANWSEYSKHKDLLNLLVYNSGDFKAINDALNNGSKVEDLVASPLVILVDK